MKSEFEFMSSCGHVTVFFAVTFAVRVCAASMMWSTCVSSALIWCLNKWFLLPGVSWQYITVKTMGPLLSSSPGTSRFAAHAWPYGKCRPGEQCTDTKWCVRAHTHKMHTLCAHTEPATCSFISLFIPWIFIFFLFPLFLYIFLNLFSATLLRFTQGDMFDSCFK